MSSDENSGTLDRRGFLTRAGLGAVTAGAAGAGLLGQGSTADAAGDRSHPPTGGSQGALLKDAPIVIRRLRRLRRST